MTVFTIVNKTMFALELASSFRRASGGIALLVLQTRRQMVSGVQRQPTATLTLE